MRNLLKLLWVFCWLHSTEVSGSPRSSRSERRSARKDRTNDPITEIAGLGTTPSAVLAMIHNCTKLENMLQGESLPFGFLFWSSFKKNYFLHDSFDQFALLNETLKPLAMLTGWWVGTNSRNSLSFAFTFLPFSSLLPTLSVTSSSQVRVGFFWRAETLHRHPLLGVCPAPEIFDSLLHSASHFCIKLSE